MRENGKVRKLPLPLLTLLAGFAVFAPAQDKKPEAATPPTTEVKPPPVSLGELSVSLESLVNRVRPAVVQIFSTGYITSDDSESSNTVALLSTQRSTGSGAILSEDG